MKFDINKPYEQILTAEMSDCNGFFDVSAWRTALYDWCVRYNPLNHGIYRSLSKDEQEAVLKAGPLFWPGSSDIQFPQKSIPAEYNDGLLEKYRHAARMAALLSRFEWGWKDDSRPGTIFEERTYRITPNGKKLQANKMKYLQYTGGPDYLTDFKYYGKKKRYLV